MLTFDDSIGYYRDTNQYEQKIATNSICVLRDASKVVDVFWGSVIESNIIYYNFILTTNYSIIAIHQWHELLDYSSDKNVCC